MHDGAAISLSLSDPDLFAPHFPGSSWTAWRAFIAALFGAPMTAEQMELFTAHTGRTRQPAVAFSEAALIVGRRGGKSRVLAFVAVALAVLRDYEINLSAGEIATIGVLASTQKQGRSIFRYVSGLLHAIPALDEMIVEETTDTIMLSNRVQIEIAAASFRSTRGYTYAAILCDEVAFWRSEESLNPDVEILRALRPGLASVPGSVLVLASSPYAKKGALYAAYRRHYGKDDARVLVWKAPTAVMNPALPAVVIADAYEEDPEAARAEYGAEFRDDLADFVTREIIDAVTMLGRHEQPPQDGVEHQAFCDPSGGASDSMTLAIAHQEGDVGILDALLEIRAPFDPDEAVRNCSALLRRYGITRVIGDHYAGKWPVARFSSHGIVFEQSARSKSDLYGDFLPLANARRIELLDHPRLASQFVSLERRTGRSGRDSIAEPKGLHDDCCNVVAGVLVGLDLDRRPGLVRAEDLLTERLALALPGACHGVFAVLAINRQGMAGVVYMALVADDLALVLDYSMGSLRGDLFTGIAARLLELARECCAARGAVAIFTETALVRQGQVAGFNASEIPEHLADAEQLLLPAAGHIAGGRVKVCAPAYEKSLTSTFGGALDFRGGDAGDDPLRRAALWGIALALDPRA